MQEYRLVPVDAWSQVEDTSSKEYTVDVKALANTVWDKRRFIAKVTAVFVALGILIALLSPVGYKVEATLLPESQVSPAGGLLQQFGGLLGLSGGLRAGNENLPPQLYPKVVNSLPYQVSLLNKKVTFAKYDTTVTLYTYFDEIRTPSIFSYIRAYTIGLPAQIMGLFAEDKPPVPFPDSVSQDSVISLTRHHLAVIKSMRSHIELSLDEEAGLVKLKATMPDPKAAASVGSYAIDLLQQYVTDYRTRKAKQYLQFVREQTENARQEYEQIQTRLARFMDQNINLATQRARTKLERLQAKKNLLFNKYSMLAQRLQQAKLKVQKKTPVLTVLQPIKVPVNNYKPQKKLIVIIALAFGLVLSVGYVVTRSVISDRKKHA